MLICYGLLKCLRYLLVIIVLGTYIAARTDSRYYAAILAMIPLYLLLMWLEKRAVRKANEQMPVTCVDATLIGYRQESYGSRVSRRRCFLTFRQEDGSGDVEFEVTQEEFDRIQIGAKGPLRYRAWQYLTFR